MRSHLRLTRAVSTKKNKPRCDGERWGYKCADEVTRAQWKGSSSGVTLVCGSNSPSYAKKKSYVRQCTLRGMSLQMRQLRTPVARHHILGLQENCAMCLGDFITMATGSVGSIHYCLELWKN